MQDELINREETLIAFADYAGSGMSMDDYGALWDIVAKMPPVNPQPKTGTWEEDIDNSRRWDKVRFYCSECGKWQTYGKTDYCPSCGARMVESQERSDKE